MKKFRNAYDYDPAKIAGEINDQPSMTVPDMTISLKELIKRSVRGGDVPQMSGGSFQEDEEFDYRPDISKMDAMEKLQYAADIKAGIAEWQKQNAENAEAETAKQLAEAERKKRESEAEKEADQADSNNPT